MNPAPRPTLENIARARSAIDPAFLDTPQFECDRLSRALGASIVLKLECLNPIRSFKGRGAEYYTHRNERTATCPWLTASAGNFGQGLAYATTKRGIPLIVFAAESASPLKLARMRELGAEVRLEGDDFDTAKQAARNLALRDGMNFIEDGRDPEITEGAGTIGIELTLGPEPFDAVLVPVGNGALVNGIGMWLKAHAPATEVIGVGAERAPAMAESFRARRPVIRREKASTLADGVAARIPVPEAVELMLEVVDDFLLVSEDAIRDAMERLQDATGLTVEGAGAVTLAAATVFGERFRGKRIALIVSGNNISGDGK